MGIVIELQREALDEKISIESLMRKAYLVARKLNLKEFEEWISQEQNGYKQEVPEYRNIAGEIKAWNPYHGWIPMVLSADISDLVSKMPIPTSISELQDVYNSSEGTVCLSVNGTLTEWFNSNMDFIPTKYQFFSTKSELYRIMSTVRNKILDWAVVVPVYQERNLTVFSTARVNLETVDQNITPYYDWTQDIQIVEMK